MNKFKYKYKNKFKFINKIILIVIFALIMTHALSYTESSTSFAAIGGINNNKSPWAKKINQALDGIGAKIVDSVIEDNEEREKYKGMEQWEIDKEKSFYITRASLSVAKEGDTIFFGTYEQDNDRENGTELIEWIVLDKDKDKVLLISKYILDNIQYHNVWEKVTWEKSQIREFLNNDFYNKSFSDKEKKMILDTNVENNSNSLYNIKAGNDTKDKIFLLSIDEINEHLPEYDKAKTAGTEYAKANDLWISKATTSEGLSVWWLRSPGQYESYASLVNAGGAVGFSGDNVAEEGNGIRPAMWVKCR